MKNKYYPLILIIVTSMSNVFAGFNMNALNVALPVISATFQASVTETSWILLSYMLFNSVLILVFGRLSDMLGKRRIYLIGVTGYAIAALLCGFAPNAMTLIILRIFQAVGAAMLVTTTTPLLSEAFPKDRLGQALGINLFMISIGQLVGPALGGFLTYNFGWQWIFWITVPVALLCSGIGFFTIKPSKIPEHREKIDVLGNFAVLLGLGGFVISLSISGEVGFLKWSVLPGFAVFAGCFLFFLIYEKRIDHPMIDLTLFKNPLFSKAVLSVLLNSTVQSSTLLLVSLHAQYVNHSDPQSAGFIVLSVALGMSIASPIAGRLAKHFQTKYLATSGLLLTCIGVIIIIVYVCSPTPLIWLIIGQLLVGLGGGVFQVPNTTIIMITAPDEKRGVANGIRSMLQNAGRLMSAAISVTLITAFLPVDSRNAVFRGEVLGLSAAEASLLSDGFVLAFAVMLAIGISAMVISWKRGKDNA